jgi:hypothetical protein
MGKWVETLLGKRNHAALEGKLEQWGY